MIAGLQCRLRQKGRQRAQAGLLIFRWLPEAFGGVGQLGQVLFAAFGPFGCLALPVPATQIGGGNHLAHQITKRGLGGGFIQIQDQLEKTTYGVAGPGDRKSTRLNSSHVAISYAVFCLKKKNHKKYVEEYIKKSQIMVNTKYNPPEIRIDWIGATTY